MSAQVTSRTLPVSTSSSLPLSRAAPAPSRSPSWNAARITREIQNTTQATHIIDLWKDHSELFDMRHYANAFSKFNQLNGNHTISNTKNVNTLKLMLQKTTQVLNKKEAANTFEKRDIREIIKSLKQIFIDDTTDNTIKTLSEIFEDSIISDDTALNTCTLSRVCTIARAYTDEQGSSNLFISTLANEVLRTKKPSADDIITMIQVVIQKGIPEALEGTFQKLIDKAITRLDCFTSNQIAKTFSILKKTEKLTPSQIESFANKLVELNTPNVGSGAIFPLDSYATDDLVSLLRNFALLGYENTDFYSAIARALSDAKLASLSINQLIGPAWTLTMSGAGNVDDVRNCLTTMLTTIATAYEGLNKLPDSDYNFSKAQMTQLLWVKRGFEAADIDFPEGILSDDLEDRAQKGSGDLPTISKTQKDVYDTLKDTYPSNNSRREGERPYIIHEPSFHGLNPDMVIQHEDRVQVVEVHGPKHYLDGRQCTRLTGQSQFKIRLLAKKAAGVANVIIISTAAWDPLRTQSNPRKTEENRREYLQQIGLLPAPTVRR